MGNIVLLDDLTINKIAAGEVIERPASVIKEMIENSIDAGANNITVEIRNGGISYIRIVDNGMGIAADDLEMAFERHATSKIRKADDLQTVRSMGFRGEALASIAAVANVELVSKTAVQSEGYRVVVEGGNILTKEEAACSTGTIITVNNLFYNTPVRYKFLKKDYTESGYIEDVITHSALVHPEIAFKFINTGKTIIQTTGDGKLSSVIYSIYGKDVAEAAITTEYKYEDIKVKGIVGKPETARSNRSRQIFFVNKRYIKDKTLSAAVAEAFKGMIPLGKFGFVVLNIELDPSKVDVNVHPAKLEVRFEEENKIFKAIYHTVKDALLKSELVANTAKEPEHKKIENTLPEVIKPHKEDRAGGLFGWRKKKKEEIDKEINDIGERDNIISQIYNDKQEEHKQEEKAQEINIQENQKVKEEYTKTPKEESKKTTGEFIDTFEVLEQLKQLQQKMQAEVDNAKKEFGYTINEDEEEKSNIDVEEEKTEYVLKAQEKLETNETDSNVVTEINEENAVIENNEINKLNQNTTTTETSEDELPKAIINMKNEHENEEQNELNNEAEAILTNEAEEVNEAQETIQNEELQKEAEEVKSKIDEMLENTEQEMPLDFKEMYYKTFGVMPKIDETEIEKEEKDINTEEDDAKKVNSAYDIISEDNRVSIFEKIEEEQAPEYRYIGIAFKTYIILEMNKELYMFDQHAAHERILYEKVKNNYYSGEVSKNSQLMLLPDVITLTHKEMDITRDNIKMFERAGFVLEEFGENTIKLSGVPEICINLDTKELFLETLDEINSIARTAKQEIEERFLATVACKAAVKAGMDLSEEEVHKLLKELLKLPNPFTCPHGRPIAIKMTKYDLERKFARK